MLFSSLFVLLSHRILFQLQNRKYFRMTNSTTKTCGRPYAREIHNLFKYFRTHFTINSLHSPIQVIDTGGSDSGVTDEDAEREQFNTLFEMCPVVRFKSSEFPNGIVYVVFERGVQARREFQSCLYISHYHCDH